MDNEALTKASMETFLNQKWQDFRVEYWIVEKIDKFKKIIPKDNDKEFNWKEYLKNNKGIKIQKITNQQKGEYNNEFKT